jgi:hypothetical protein
VEKTEELIEEKTKKTEELIAEKTKKTEEFIAEKTKKTEEFIAEKTKKTEELIEEKTKKTEELIEEKTKKTEELIGEKTKKTEELIAEIVHKIHKYYEWFFSIKTWNAKYSYSPHIPPFERELDADDLTNLQHTLIPHNKLFLLFESTLKIMEKHFGMYKRPIPNSNNKHYIFTTNDDGLRKGNIEAYYEVVKYAKFDPSRNYLDFNDYKIAIDRLKENQRNYYESFLLSVKDIDETDEEFELRFLTHLLSICKETYSNYKLYMIAQGPKN